MINLHLTFNVSTYAVGVICSKIISMGLMDFATTFRDIWVETFGFNVPAGFIRWVVWAVILSPVIYAVYLSRKKATSNETTGKRIRFAKKYVEILVAIIVSGPLVSVFLLPAILLGFPFAVLYVGVVLVIYMFSKPHFPVFATSFLTLGVLSVVGFIIFWVSLSRTYG